MTTHKTTKQFNNEKKIPRPSPETLYLWLTQNTNPESLTTWNSFLNVHYKVVSHLFIDDSTKLISHYTKNNFSPKTQLNTDPNITQSAVEVCLPFRLFKTAFDVLHDHFQTVIKILILLLPIFLSLFSQKMVCYFNTRLY